METFRREEDVLGVFSEVKLKYSSRDSCEMKIYFLICFVIGQSLPGRSPGSRACIALSGKRNSNEKWFNAVPARESFRSPLLVSIQQATFNCSLEKPMGPLKRGDARSSYSPSDSFILSVAGNYVDV